MEELIIQRINHIISSNNLNASSFAKKIDIPQKTVNNYLNGSRKLSLEFIFKIISSFELNANWLIMGTGEMFLTTKSVNENEFLIKRFEELSGEKALLQKEVEDLKRNREKNVINYSDIENKTELSVVAELTELKK